jgi:hypothetical protein
MDFSNLNQNAMKTLYVCLFPLLIALFCASTMHAQKMRVEVGSGDANAAFNGGFLLLGNTGMGAANLGFDDNSIQARLDGGISSLFIQEFGGNTILNKNGGRLGIGTDTPPGILSISASGNNVETLSFTEDGSADASFFFRSRLRRWGG